MMATATEIVGKDSPNASKKSENLSQNNNVKEMFKSAFSSLRQFLATEN